MHIKDTDVFVDEERQKNLQQHFLYESHKKGTSLEPGNP